MPSTEEIIANPKALIDFFSGIDNQLTTAQEDPVFMMGQQQQQQQGGFPMLTAGPSMGMGNVGYSMGMGGVNPFQQPQPMAIEHNLQTTNPFALNNGAFDGVQQQGFSGSHYQQGYNNPYQQPFNGGGAGQLQLYNEQQAQQQQQNPINPFAQHSQQLNGNFNSNYSSNNSSFNSNYGGNNPFQQQGGQTFNAFGVGRPQGASQFGSQSQQNAFTVGLRMRLR